CARSGGYDYFDYW
nr:immunoglobulin heavy chain junction region [Mus musculus]